MKHLQRFNENSQDFKEELFKMIADDAPIYKIMGILRDKIGYVPDGVWDISDIDFIELSPQYVLEGKSWRKLTEDEIKTHLENLSSFLDNNPNCVIADAYQTEHPFLLATKPTKQVKYMGSGFNRGSNNIIDNCPKRILICGEDD